MFIKQNIKVLYTIDRYVGKINDEIKMFRPEELLPEVDILIVTAYDYENIVKNVNLCNIKKVISLKELINAVNQSI